ncbi:MAG: polyprenol monophosphomannose synthase [Thermoplasmata archaeon]|nr:MAG: polyprenol monophosphomannose synthase [Thermoplasmata archaeon]
MKISVIMPTYNEKENIESLIHAVLKSLQDEVEIVVVDDNSPDGTWNIVEKMDDERIILVRRIDERGLASAIKRGIETAKGDVIVVMDTDFSHPPKKIPDMISALGESDIALGSRHTEGGKMEASKARVFLSKMINLFARIFLGSEIRDYTGGFLAVRKEIFRDIQILDEWGGYGNYCIGFLYAAKKKGYRIKEVPFVYKYRTAGETKTAPEEYNLFRWGKRYCLTVLKLRFENL